MAELTVDSRVDLLDKGRAVKTAAKMAVWMVVCLVETRADGSVET